MASILVDTGLASLILDGELWWRLLSTLAIHQPGVAEAMCLAKTSTEVVRENLHLRRSVLVYAWTSKKESQGARSPSSPPSPYSSVRAAICNTGEHE